MSVSSVQFVERIPTAQHSDPALHLGRADELNRTHLQFRKKPCTSSSFVAQEHRIVVDDVFRKQKHSCLSKIDLSKKGSIDEAVADVVVFINHLDQYFTTSSCSGRIYIYEEVRKLATLLIMSETSYELVKQNISTS